MCKGKCSFLKNPINEKGITEIVKWVAQEKSVPLYMVTTENKFAIILRKHTDQIKIKRQKLTRFRIHYPNNELVTKITETNKFENVPVSVN